MHLNQAIQRVDTGPDQLLSTKLYPPQLRAGLLPRPQLTGRLEEGLEAGHRLALISAPAGFGKSILIVEWLAGRDHPVAWVSLDAGDNDPARFLSYLVAALESLGLPLSADLPAALRAPQPPPIPSVLGALVNDLDTLSSHRPAASQPVLVLDDYHVIQAREVHDAVAFLLEHLPAPPAGPHLVIASRSDPPLSLARLRAQGVLTELRAADLRFTSAEAASLLRDITGLPISDADLAALQARTEGWVTGLQLAALALQDLVARQGCDAADASAEQIPRFVQEFSGSHRFVLDYLIEEVVSRQPPHVQRFLLQTSVLHRLSGPLCDALTGRNDGQESLEALERANLFLVPLDAVRRWYRYHRLFADLLQSRLARLGPGLGCAPASQLHRLASQWYQAQALVPEAVRHALDAGDYERAASLVEEQGLEMLKRGEMAALLDWLAALPARAIQSRPQLSIYHGWAQALSGQLDAVEPNLQAAELGAEVSPPDDRHGQIATIRAYVALQRGNLPRACELVERSLLLLDEKNLVVRSVVALTRAGLYLRAGDRPSAARALAQASQMGHASGNIHLAVSASAMLAGLELERGQLHRAFEAYSRALDMAGPSPVAAQAHSGLAQVLYEWNDVEAASDHMAQCIALGKLWGNVDALISDTMLQAWLSRAQGDNPGAARALRAAEELARTRGLPPQAAAQVAAGHLRLALAQGDLAAVERWVHDDAPDPDGEINPVNEWAYLLLARSLLALGQFGSAERLLERLLKTIEQEGRWGSGIQILVLQALTQRAQGGADQALLVLERALSLAQPERYVRSFVDEGSPMQALLSSLRLHLLNHPANGGGPDRERRLAYVSELLAAFAASVSGAPAASGDEEARSADSPLVEPLSPRELDVLRLVAAGLTNQAIADRLFIAVSTVKSHTHSIYGKLGVRNRTQAIAQARTLGLL